MPRGPARCTLVRMVASRRSRRAARCVLSLGLACYLLALGLTPSLHHGLECHVKTPTHCDACMASPPGLCPAAGVSLDATLLHDAGSVEAARTTLPVLAFALDTPGRSPPA